MSRYEKVSIFIVEIRYLSRTVPTYLRRDWRYFGSPEVGSLGGADAVATFNLRDDAEAEAVSFVAAYPSYLGCVTVKALVENGNVTFRD